MSIIMKTKKIIITVGHIKTQNGITKLIFKSNMKFFQQNVLKRISIRLHGLLGLVFSNSLNPVSCDFVWLSLKSTAINTAIRKYHYIYTYEFLSVSACVHVGMHMCRGRLSFLLFSYYLLTETCRHIDYKLLEVIYHCGASHFQWVFLGGDWE